MNMYNEYYPENTSPDGFENYGGHHIDDRMRARGSSYASRRPVDDKAPHYATPEIMEEKRQELATLEAEYDRLHESIYGGNSLERLVGDDLALALVPLESLAERIESARRFIATAHVIDAGALNSERVQILSEVTVGIQGISAPMRLRIVGQNEAISSKDVSCVSPVGKALLGRKVGESVDVQVNGRVLSYRILSL